MIFRNATIYTLLVCLQQQYLIWCGGCDETLWNLMLFLQLVNKEVFSPMFHKTGCELGWL